MVNEGNHEIYHVTFAEDSVLDDFVVVYEARYRGYGPYACNRCDHHKGVLRIVPTVLGKASPAELPSTWLSEWRVAPILPTSG